MRFLIAMVAGALLAIVMPGCGGNLIETTGNLTISAGCDVDVTSLPGSTLTVGAVASLNGSSGDWLEASTWTLTATTSASADFVRVRNSDASGGSAVTATNSVDYGSNQNWSGTAAQQRRVVSIN